MIALRDRRNSDLTIPMQDCFKPTGRMMTASQPFARWGRGLRLIVLAVIFGPLLSSCAHMSKLTDSGRNGPFFTPQNFAGDKTLSASIRRVLVMPVYGGSVAEGEVTLVLDEVMMGALQKQARFEVVALPRDDCQRRVGRMEIASVALLPNGFLDELGKAYGVDAVLFIDLTIYHPYGALAVGFRAKLATTHEVRLIWSFDDAFSLANPSVVNSVYRYSRAGGSTQAPIDMTLGTLQSPRRFAAYAADAMFGTLPPR